MEESTRPRLEDDEITLKEAILKGQEFFEELLKNWKLISLLGVLLAVVLLYLAKKTPVTYPAQITFMVNETSGNGDGGVSAILGQFGLGSGGGGEYNLDKIIELSKSLRIMREVFFEKVEIGGTSDYIANHLIRSEKLHKKWKKDTTGLNNFLFKKSNFAAFSNLENKALKKVYGKVKGNPKNKTVGLFSSYYSEDTGILTMELNSQSEEVSILFLKEMYIKMSTFYIEEATEKPKTTYLNIKTKEDSLKGALNAKEYQLAKVLDKSFGLVTKSAQVQIDRLRRDVQLLTVAYGEALRNASIAEFSLDNAMPFFQIIDNPIAPIEKKKESGLKAILVGGLLGGFLACIFVIFRKFIRDVMKEENGS